MSWWQKYGAAEYPVRQSHLNAIAAETGCPKRFFYEQEELLSGDTRERKPHWRMALGTAVHAVIERGLVNAWDVLVRTWGPGSEFADRGPTWAPATLRAKVVEALREEMDKAAGVDADGQPRPIDWYDDDPETEMAAGVAMVLGALRTTVERADSIVACEAPFLAQLDSFTLAGTIDLIYRRRGDRAVCLDDWKSGERKMDPILVNHGYQGAIYHYAVEHGVLFPGDPREMRLGVAPAEMHIVHLRDFVPYVKKPRTPGKNVGDLRGPGWYASTRTSEDVNRLRVSLRTVTKVVRMNCRLEKLGNQCGRCPYREQCLNAGRDLSKTEAREIEHLLTGIDLDGTGGDAEAA